jgi:hypothetical protein
MTPEELEEVMRVLKALTPEAEKLGYLLQHYNANRFEVWKDKKPTGRTAIEITLQLIPLLDD